MTSNDAELRPRRMSGLSSIQMVRSAKLLSIWTCADSLATADFRYKSAIFCARGFPPMPQARNLSAERPKWQSSLATLPYQAKGQCGRVGPHYVTAIMRTMEGIITTES